jgi:hypothetical protein
MDKSHVKFQRNIIVIAKHPQKETLTHVYIGKDKIGVECEKAIRVCRRKTTTRNTIKR